jgi:CheY-like chemotaxis protein/glycine cleavage system H lipoate-binding protein
MTEVKGRPRILVVDDEEIVRRSVQKILRDDDCDLEFAESAEAALTLLQARPFDLVITDLTMPGLTGLQLLDRLAGLPQRPAAILITGYATLRTAIEALRRGAGDYIAKPFSRTELRAAVVRALRGRSLDLSPTAGAPPVETRYALRDHSWARPLGDGDVLVGFESGFLKVVGEPARIDLPAVGTTVQQGRPCAELVGTDGHPHGLWAPVSGTVAAVNEAVRKDPRWIKNDPHGDGWVLRVTPDRLDDELPILSRV